MKKYVLGCDGGTGGMRVGIFDLDGREIAFAATSYETQFEHPGWAEQNPLDWWEALAHSIKKATDQAGIQKEEILALSYDGTCGSLVMARADGTPLGNSLIWMDVRATEEAKLLTATKHPCLKFNGFGNVSPEWIPCKALWLKRHRRTEYDKAEVICEYCDWITYKLTKKWTANYSSVSSRWYFDIRNGGYPTDFYEEIGLADLLDKYPREIHYLGDNLGTIDHEAADYLGLPYDTIIGQGGVDASVGMFGLGVTRPGRVAFVTGSSHLILGLTDKYEYGKGYFGPFPDAIRKGMGLVEGGQISTGSIVKWYKDNFCCDLGDTSSEAYAVLNEQAKTVSIGADGLIVMDWWQGNRNPYTDSNIRGMIYGLSLQHNKAHIFRAIMEGVAFGTENILKTLRQTGLIAKELCISGGTTNSELWMQIHADVSNVIVNVPDNVQAPAKGAAILAACASGVYDVDEAVSRMVHYSKKIYPNEENHKKYQKLFHQYELVYPRFHEWMHETTELLTYNKE